VIATADSKTKFENKSACDFFFYEKPIPFPLSTKKKTLALNDPEKNLVKNTFSDHFVPIHETFHKHRNGLKNYSS